MNEYVSVLKKYAVFDGRAARKEFWMFTLISLLITIGLSIVDNILGWTGTLSGLYTLAVFIPTLAVSVRRLHDIGYSGWWLLLCLVPFIGALVILVFWVMDSQTGANKYGPSPKGAAPAAPVAPPPAPPAPPAA